MSSTVISIRPPKEKLKQRVVVTVQDRGGRNQRAKSFMVYGATVAQVHGMIRKAIDPDNQPPAERKGG